MTTEQKPEETTEEKPEIPEKWKTLPIGDMVDKGWRPRIKEVGERSYITMRFGRQERSLGPYTEERWKLLLEMHPKLKAIAQHAARARELKGRGSLLTLTIKKPKPLKSSSNISLEALSWFEWVQSKGYPGTLGDFLNEIVHDYFKARNLERPIVIVRGEKEFDS